MRWERWKGVLCTLTLRPVTARFVPFRFRKANDRERRRYEREVQPRAGLARIK